jgi:hypothetical protein
VPRLLRVELFDAIRARPGRAAIADGLAFGCITCAALKRCTGRAREVHPQLWIIAAVFLYKFAFAGGHRGCGTRPGDLRQWRQPRDSS